MVQVTVSDEVLSQPMTLRIKFFKVGVLQYISHLDLVRTLTRTLLRAGLPMWYSEGFNPRPKMTFATPMSVGLQSRCEYMDIKLGRRVDCDAVKKALNANLPPEMQATDVYYPDTKFASLAYSLYDIRIVTEGADVALAEKINELVKNKPIVVVKRSKSGDRETDISSYIKDIEASFAEGEIRISAIIRSDSERFLNPEYVITYLKSQLGILSGFLLAEHYSIMRERVMTEELADFI